MTSLSFASGQVDPRELTASQLKGLERAAAYRLTRVKGGWRAPGTPLLSLPVAQRLTALKLVMRRDYNGVPRLEITGAGRYTLAVADQRRQRSAVQ